MEDSVVQQQQDTQDVQVKIAILSTKLDAMEEEFKMHEEKDETRMEEINKKLDFLSSQMGNTKSFIGGVVFVISCLWAVFVVFKENLFHK